MASPKVTPGQALTSQQKTGLDLISRLHGGRDVVLAIDLTESVGLNDEGRTRLRQIVQDSLQPGDSVYVVPFAATVNPLSPNINPIGLENYIKFNGKKSDIEEILQAIPFQPDLRLQKTDIQLAELNIYQNLAEINQLRLQQNLPVKPQSVVWITDAPLFSKLGAEWIETPADSPLRLENSQESQQRQAWMQALPLDKRSLSITTDNNKQYNLTVVDIPATVQEFCTPAPGGRETCLVTPYLIKQLWLPGLISFVFLITLAVALTHWISLQKKWQLTVDFDPTKKDDDKICYLPNNKRIAIGEYEPNCLDSIDTPGTEVRAYLVRKGNKLYLEPTGEAPIYYNGREIISRTLLSSSRININCPDSYKRDFEFVIKIKK